MIGNFQSVEATLKCNERNPIAVSQSIEGHINKIRFTSPSEKGSCV